jgi:N utilization substance protein A
MDTSSELIEALRQIEREKGVETEVLFTAIEQALVAACKKNYDFDAPDQEVRVIIDRGTGKISVYVQKDVVESVLDESIEISIENARRIHKAYEIGDVCDVLVTPRNFGRIAAQTAKQIVTQKIRDAERERVYLEFKERERDIITGIIQRRERRGVIIEVGKNEVMLEYNEQIPHEPYIPGERIKLYVVEVTRTTKAPRIIVSRSHPDIVRCLFEQEVPEISDELVEIVNVSREAGSRAKIAVRSNNPRVDPVGSCVGQNGYRVNAVVNELRGEKVDIIPYNDDPRMFIASALSPSPVLAVVIDDSARHAKVVVPDRQLSLAIGKDGQNVRLAARLTSHKIDIKGDSQARSMNWIDGADYMPPGGYNDNKYSAQGLRAGLPGLPDLPDDEEYYEEEGYADDGYDEGYDDYEQELGSAEDYEQDYADYYGEQYDEYADEEPADAAETETAAEAKTEAAAEATAEAAAEAAEAKDE